MSQEVVVVVMAHLKCLDVPGVLKNQRNVPTLREYGVQLPLKQKVVVGGVALTDINRLPTAYI
jgi:hypothetical protein